MIKIGVVEDSVEDASRLKECIEKYQGENNLEFSVNYFTSPINLVDKYSNDYDIVFLDIRTPAMDGITAAKKIRALSSTVIIIFITSLAQYAIKGYEVEALDFIVKPLNYYEFALKFQRALTRVHNETISIMINTNGSKLNIPSSEIFYIETRNHQCVVHTAKGEFPTYVTLTSLEEKLASANFTRCNNCFLVNLMYINNYKGYSLFLKNGEKLQISQPKRKVFVQKVMLYWEGKEWQNLS